MGCGRSRPREPSAIVYGTGQLVHSSRNSYRDVPLLQMYKKIEDQLVAEIQETRANRHAATERLVQARGTQGLQARGSLMSIYSTSADVFAVFLADCPEYVNLPTFGSNTSNAIAGSFMLSKANELQEVIEGHGSADAAPLIKPNSTLLDAALENVLRFKALWGSRMLVVTLLMVEHLTLGRVALVQPLLVAACMQRVYNWAPDVDPVFDVLLQAGASANGRNSLNMTALMLVATSLMAQLESRTVFSSSGAQELTGQIAQTVETAAATVRQLLAAGADPAAEMRGFGAKWDPNSRAASLLPSSIRFARHVLHLERYTVQHAFELMRHTLDEQIQRIVGSEGIQVLDDFASLLRAEGKSAEPAASGLGLHGGGGGAGGESVLTYTSDEPPLGAAAMRTDLPNAEEPEVGAMTYSSSCYGSGAVGGRDTLNPPADGSALLVEPGQAQDSRLQPEPPPRPPPPQQHQQEQLQGHQLPLQQGRQEARQQKERIAARVLTWPWIQAMSNIAWAVSQVAMVESARGRRALLRQLVQEAPFCLPHMSVVSVEQLLAAGCLPRYSRQQGSSTCAQSARTGVMPEGLFQPFPADELPPSAVVVFVSHRWLGRGCPDDGQHTKLKQVLAIADHISKLRSISQDQVYLWLDYSVVDQDNPVAGVQALPIYIACCEEFVYVHHDEYWQRAWCLTEQFMHWKLATSGEKHVLQPHSLALVTESARERPPDPTYGKLAVEADRVALATMTSILPYDV